MLYSIHNKTIIDQKYTEINPVDSGYMQCPPLHAYGPAVRNNWLLHFVISGKGYFETSRGRYEIEQNNIFIIKPHEITYYKADEKEPWKYVWIGFTSGINIPSILKSSDIVFIPSLRNTFLELTEILDGKTENIAYVDKLCSITWDVISKLRALEECNGKNKEIYVKEALNIMESEYHRSIDVSEIAARLHVNRSYFTVIFKEIMKCSPHKYLMKLRMERAAEMLKAGCYNVGIIASSVGYSDLFVFSRAFKSFFGVSPTQYMK